MDSPFDVLAVDPDADDEEIERAYRERVKEVHPDQGGSSEEFQLLQTAYERLQSGEYDADREANEDADEEDNDADYPDIEYLDYEAIVDHGWSLEDDDLFEKAAEAGLETADYGTFQGSFDDYLLNAAEEAGHTWPYSCRSTACANCAIALIEGEIAMPKNHILPDEMLDRGIRLSCVGTPTTDKLKVVYNVKHLPELDELRLPPGPFDGGRASD